MRLDDDVLRIVDDDYAEDKFNDMVQELRKKKALQAAREEA